MSRAAELDRSGPSPRSRVVAVLALGGLAVVAVSAVLVARATDPDELDPSSSAPADTTDMRSGSEPADGTAPVTDVPLAPATAAVGAVDVSALPVLLDVAPAIEAEQWLNTEPLTPRDLVGKVVLYDFWTFGCINCKRTLPYVKAWHERYATDGLVVLSVHTPEFAHERDPAAVQEFLVDNDITYAVALDPDKKNWRRFENRFWPRFYLHDRTGARRYDHIGEGAYDETEDTIRALLGVDPAAPRAVVKNA